MSENFTPTIGIVQRTRKSPYFDATVRAGVKGFSVYNHMLMPIFYDSPQADYWHLINNVTMWDVAVERQVEITGPDAHTLVQYMTPRNLSKCKVGQCKYVPIIDENGGVLNDPVLLKLAENHYWLSLADSDILLYAKGLANGHGWDVEITEPDVSPLAIQGPNWLPVAQKLFGDWITKLRFFRFKEVELEGIPLIVARSGWSKQGGLELYLRDGQYGTKLWELVEAAGAEYGIKPATPSTIERIESGLLSYGNDMTIDENPYEVNLGKYCDLDQEADFIGKEALKKIVAKGITRAGVGLIIETDGEISNQEFWPILNDAGERVGKVTSAVYSPRLKKNIALAVVDSTYTAVDTQLKTETPTGQIYSVTVHKLPFI